jgi:hypothetical protein
MAAVTLKDLMDPLVKIAAATEKTAQKIDAVVAAVTGGAGASLDQEIITELRVQTDLLRTIAGNTKSGSAIKVDGKEIKQDKLKEGAEAIKMLGGGASSLAFGLLTFMLVPNKVIKKFTATIKDLMAAFDDLDPDKVEKGSKAFELIAQGVGRFARGLAMAGILFIPALIGVALVSIAFEILMPTLEKLGDSEKTVGEGVKVLDLMGGALISFAKGLVLAAIGATVGILFTPVIVLAMILIGGAFALLGKFDRSIRQGARATRLMGKALIFFSIGLVTFALASLFIIMKPAILLAMVGTLVLIGTAFAILGMFDKSIRKGAVAIFVMSISLVIFSIAYLIFGAVAKNVTMEDVFIQAGLLVGTGLAFAIIGKLFGQIVPGALAVAAMGLGLLVFSLGYLPFAMVTKDMTLESVATQAGILLALGLEFAAAGVGALFILGGAAAFAAVGISLAVLAGGLAAWKAVRFTKEDADAMTTTLVGIKTAFLGNAGKDEGFFSKLGGALTGAVDAVRMVEAAAGFTAAGIALATLSFGLKKFKEVKWNDDLSKELVTMLNGVTTAFALAGSSEQVPSSSFFGQMFGFKRTAVEEGINSVLGAGRALKDIAKGLQAFQALIDSGVNFGQPDDKGRYEKGTLGYAVTNTIGFINEAFAAVAEQGNVDAGGVFGSLFGIKKNKVAEGIDSVKGAGKELSNIATGLKTFQELVDKGINWDNLGDAVTKSLGFVGTAFAKIGGMETTDSTGLSSLFGISWDENSVEKGVDAVQGAGKELMQIAKGLETFQKMIDSNVDFNKLGTAIKNSLTFVGDAFMAIGGKEQTDSSFFGLIEWDENIVNKGIENVKGAGEELINIAKGLQAFSDLKDPVAIAKSIKEIFTSIGDTFTFYYEKPKFSGQLDHMKIFVQSISHNAKKGYIHKAADGMSKIAKAVNSIDSVKAEAFANLFKGAGELTDNKAAFKALLDAVEDIREALAGGSDVPTPPPPGGGPTPPGGGDTKGLGPTLARINTTLAGLSTTMGNLPSQIQAIEIKVNT